MLAKSTDMTMATRAPTTIRGFRTPIRSEMIPATTTVRASTAQNQFPMPLALAWL